MGGSGLWEMNLRRQSLQKRWRSLLIRMYNLQCQKLFASARQSLTRTQCLLTCREGRSAHGALLKATSSRNEWNEWNGWYRWNGWNGWHGWNGWNGWNGWSEQGGLLRATSLA